MSRHHRLHRHATAAAVLLTLLLGALAASGAVGVPAARADGDPASDELIAQNVFYPYSSPVGSTLQQRLNAAVAAAHRAHLALKIALIAHPTDLGSVSALFGKPQQYARFLDIELSYGRKVPLLVVMAGGFGSVGLPSRLGQTVAGARAPAAGTGTGLATAALSLVTRLDGELTTGHVGHASTGSNSSFQTRTILLLALILAAVLVGGLLIIARVFFPPATEPDAKRAAKARGR